MNGPTTTDALPTAEQMRNYLAAGEAAWRAKRMQDASRALVTGNIAGAVCLMETTVVVVHAGWLAGADGTGDALRAIGLAVFVWGCIAWMFLSLRWLKFRRSVSPVFVLNRLELRAAEAPPRPRTTGALLLGYFVFMFLMTGLWTVAFAHLSNSAILALLSVGPALAAGYFAYRFLTLHFWEDVLFAAAVALAWLPFPLMAWHLAPVCLATFPLVLVATVSLHLRWARWQRAVSLQAAVPAAPEGRP